MKPVVVGTVWQFQNQDQPFTAGHIKLFDDDGKVIAEQSLVDGGHFRFEVEPHGHYTFGVYNEAGESLAIHPSKLVAKPGINERSVLVLVK